MRARRRGRVECLPVPARTVVKNRSGPLGDGHADALTAVRDILHAALDQRDGFAYASPHGGECDRAVRRRAAADRLLEPVDLRDEQCRGVEVPGGPGSPALAAASVSRGRRCHRGRRAPARADRPTRRVPAAHERRRRAPAVRRACGARRTQASARRRGRTTARRPRDRSAAARRLRRSAARVRQDRPGTCPEAVRCSARMPWRALPSAEAEGNRRARGTGRAAATAPRTGTPSPTRLPPRGRCGVLRRAPPGDPVERTSRFRHHRRRTSTALRPASTSETRPSSASHSRRRPRSRPGPSPASTGDLDGLVRLLVPGDRLHHLPSHRSTAPAHRPTRYAA